MRGAVSELSRALARLFEMIRADRAAQHTRIAELEQALAEAQAHVRELEAGGAIAAGEPEHPAAPSPTDFDALRGAAERLRLRTEQLVRQAGTPAEEAAREAEARAEADAERAAEDERIEAARLAVEASLAEEEADAARRAAMEGSPALDLPSRPVHDEPYGEPGILRVFPGAVLRPRPDDLDVESELGFDELAPRQMAARHAVPTISDEPAEVARHGLRTSTDADAADAHLAGPEANGNGPDANGDGAGAEASGDAGGGLATVTKPAEPATATVPRPEPIPVTPRAARKRKGLLKRRRIDARKLTGVDPAAALRALVSAVDQLWTAGTPLDLVIALTDGGALRVSGGDREPLQVSEVEPGTPARSTVTATSAQLVPLFGRLELTDEQSVPLIHGARRDADLLVGWIDRAQRLPVEPL